MKVSKKTKTRLGFTLFFQGFVVAVLVMIFGGSSEIILLIVCGSLSLLLAIIGLILLIKEKEITL